jgi:hypothetical protein
MRVTEAIGIIREKLPDTMSSYLNEAWQTLMSVVPVQQTTNNARDEILLCAAHHPCKFQDDIKCTTKSVCTEQRKTSPVA